MSWANAIDEIKSRIEATGLTYTPDVRDDDLTALGVARGKFDGSFSIIQEGDTKPFRDKCPASGARIWRTRVRIHVGTEVTNDAFEQGKLVETRAQAVTDALLFPDPSFAATDIAQIQIARDAQRTRRHRQIFWDQRFDVIYRG